MTQTPDYSQIELHKKRKIRTNITISEEAWELWRSRVRKHGEASELLEQLIMEKWGKKPE